MGMHCAKLVPIKAIPQGSSTILNSHDDTQEVGFLNCLILERVQVGVSSPAKVWKKPMKYWSRMMPKELSSRLKTGFIPQRKMHSISSKGSIVFTKVIWHFQNYTTTLIFFCPRKCFIYGWMGRDGIPKVSFNFFLFRIIIHIPPRTQPPPGKLYICPPHMTSS